MYEYPISLLSILYNKYLLVIRPEQLTLFHPVTIIVTCKAKYTVQALELHI